MVLANPQVRDVARPSPGMAGDGCNNFTGRIPDRASKDLSVMESCCLGIELVDPIDQERVDLCVAVTAELDDVRGNHVRHLG